MHVVYAAILLGCSHSKRLVGEFYIYNYIPTLKCDLSISIFLVAWGLGYQLMLPNT